jgi:hypothetical protein
MGVISAHPVIAYSLPSQRKRILAGIAAKGLRNEHIFPLGNRRVALRPESSRRYILRNCNNSSFSGDRDYIDFLNIPLETD